MVLFGSMSGRLLGGFTAGIIVNIGLVVHVVVEGRQVALDERQFVTPCSCRDRRPAGSCVTRESRIKALIGNKTE
jgi:hypothetical protein